MFPESGSSSWSTTTFSNDTLTISPTTNWSIGSHTLSITITDINGHIATIDLTYSITADSDGDGFTIAAGDCNDSDANINPGATEVCDLKDNDCDALTDEPSALDAVLFYQDSDGDSFGNLSISQLACFTPDAYVSDDTDCNDSEASTNPGATEFCDGIDNDCDSVADNGVSPPPTPCEATNEFGTCPGTWTCAGAGGWTCDAVVPTGSTGSAPICP